MNKTRVLTRDNRPLLWLTATFLWFGLISLGRPPAGAGAAILPFTSPNYRTIVRKTYLLDSIPIAMETVTTDQAGTTRARHDIYTDHLGSVSALVDAAGTVIERPRFDPFGAPEGARPAGVTTRGYTGHRHENELGLIYMNARWYDPLLGRFLSADPLIPDLMNPQALNRYAYVMNNPLKWNDPSGRCAQGDADYALCAAEYHWLRDHGAGGTIGLLDRYQRRTDFQILKAVFLSYRDRGLTLASMWDYTWDLVRDSGGDILLYGEEVAQIQSNIMGYRYEALHLSYTTQKDTSGKALITANDFLVYLFEGSVPVSYLDAEENLTAKMYEDYHLFYLDNRMPGVKETVDTLNSLEGAITVSMSDAFGIFSAKDARGLNKLATAFDQFLNGARYRNRANYYYFELHDNPQVIKEIVGRSYYGMSTRPEKAQISWRTSP